MSVVYNESLKMSLQNSLIKFNDTSCEFHLCTFHIIQTTKYSKYRNIVASGVPLYNNDIVQMYLPTV